MKYTPQLYPRTDTIGNTRQVWIQYDNANEIYVGSLRLGAPRRMVSGKMNAPIAATGEGSTPNAAADATMENFQLRQTRAGRTYLRGHGPNPQALTNPNQG